MHALSLMNKPVTQHKFLLNAVYVCGAECGIPFYTLCENEPDGKTKLKRKGRVVFHFFICVFPVFVSKISYILTFSTSVVMYTVSLSYGKIIKS